MNLVDPANILAISEMRSSPFTDVTPLENNSSVHAFFNHIMLITPMQQLAEDALQQSPVHFWKEHVNDDQPQSAAAPQLQHPLHRKHMYLLD
jgi:hypothetical protein